MSFELKKLSLLHSLCGLMPFVTIFSNQVVLFLLKLDKKWKIEK
ncbi:hypothetical protein RV12_GL001726 [Enterococcus quebecensis]|nr:hypothetical protein RV12_GL001726 [Enterococcus quebecensis]